MHSFRAYRIHQDGNQIQAGFETLSTEQLTDGDVLIQVAYSDINYKDALAVTGKGRILRKYPLNGGIDMAGRVVSSESPLYKTGDAVIACGTGLSEFYDGGYAEFTRLPAEAIQPLPTGLSMRDAMAIGTAGFTAAVAVQRMEDNGQVPENGPIVVTGATGGVGSFAISLFSGLGYEVLGLTGKPEQQPYLESLGASGILNRHDLEMGTKPLLTSEWGGAVDNVGGETLSWLTRTVNPWGNIACIGLAGGIELNTTVMPLILRGVSLLGINCMELPAAMKALCWSRLAEDLKPRHLDIIAPRTIAFKQLPSAFDELIKGTQTARTVVEIDGSV